MAVLISVTLITLVILIAVIIIVWLYSYSLSFRFQKKVKHNENSVRTFIIDMKEKTVKYFNRSSIEKLKSISLEQFFTPFSSDQVNRINEWINNLLKKSIKTDEFLEVEVYIGALKKKYDSILDCTYIDYDKKILHIDSYLFMHLTIRNKLGKKYNNIGLEEAIRRLRIHPSIRGFTYNFKFTCFTSQSIKKEINKLLFTQLKEIAICHAYPPSKYLIEVSNDEFAIIDTRANDYTACMDLIHSIIEDIQCFLQVNGLNKYVTIAVGMVSNVYFPGNIKKLISKAQEMSDIAFERNVLVITYSKSMLNNAEDKFDSEIEHVIKEKKLMHTFTPIYDVIHGKTVGYINNVAPINTSAKTIKELYLRAVKTDESKKLLQAVVKEAYTLFNEENTNDENILFINLKMPDALSFLSFAKLSSIKEVNTVAVFDEYDVSYYKNNNKDFFEIITKFKNKRIMPCLKLSDKNLVLDSSIYAAFSYFIVDFKIDKIHRLAVNDIDYRVIVEKLLKYNRPIILANVIGWTNIELLVRSGITYISSPTMVTSDKKINVIPTKNIAKIKRMLN